MKTVLLPEPIPSEGRRLLEGRVRIVETPDHTPVTLKKFIRDVHGVILRTGARITAEMIAEAPYLQVIARTGVGVDNVDVKAATERGIYVCHVPDANVVSVAEHVMTLLLALSKQLKILDVESRRGNFAARYQYITTELSGKTLGIIGLGKIGREVAERTRRGLGMKVLVFDPYVGAQEARRIGAEPFDSLREMLSQSDAVTLHVPLVSGTRKMIGHKELTLMKNTAYLVNLARGELVDEEALFEFLEQNRIAGAAVDVFAVEPPQSSPLLTLNNVLATPHIAAYTYESMERMDRVCAQTIIDTMQGKPCPNILNPEVSGKHT